MSDLDPVAFDIESSGLGTDAVVTVAGFCHELGAYLILNTQGRDADAAELTRCLERAAEGRVDLTVVETQPALLRELGQFVDDHLDGDRHYVTAFNGETWRGGFDLPFCRTRYLEHDLTWPFGDIAYADMMQMVDRFDTGDTSDLVGVYDALIGGETSDPFDDSARAVETFEDGEWEPLLLHNLADIQRTRELAIAAGRMMPKSDFNMKSLDPPQR